MSNLLGRLVGRTLGEGEVIEPRRASRFEPVPEGGAGHLNLAGAAPATRESDEPRAVGEADGKGALGSVHAVPGEPLARDLVAGSEWASGSDDEPASQAQEWRSRGRSLAERESAPEPSHRPLRADGESPEGRAEAPRPPTLAPRSLIAEPRSEAEEAVPRFGELGTAPHPGLEPPESGLRLRPTIEPPPKRTGPNETAERERETESPISHPRLRSPLVDEGSGLNAGERPTLVPSVPAHLELRPRLREDADRWNNKTQASGPTEERVIKVTIGRLEVRAVQTKDAPNHRELPEPAVMGLEDYLRESRGDRSRGAG